MNNEQFKEASWSDVRRGVDNLPQVYKQCTAVSHVRPSSSDLKRHLKALYKY